MIVAWKQLLAGQHQAAGLLAFLRPGVDVVVTLCSGAFATESVLAGQHQAAVGPALALPEG